MKATITPGPWGEGGITEEGMHVARLKDFRPICTVLPVDPAPPVGPVEEPRVRLPGGPEDWANFHAVIAIPYMVATIRLIASLTPATIKAAPEHVLEVIIHAARDAVERLDR